MPDITDPDDFEPDHNRVEQITASAEVKKNAWQATLDEMEALAADYEDADWDVATISALEVATTPSSESKDGRWGLIYLIPDNQVEPFQRLFQRGDFPQYEVYRQEVEGDVFLVTVLTDPETEAALLLAGAYTGMHALGLVDETKEQNHVYTHVRTLDGTYYGTFRHEQPAKFFPRYEEFAGRFGTEHSIGVGDEE